MSKNIKVQISKINPDEKLENLLNSYNTLKSILLPNLNENNNLFMNSLIDLISSQLKIFVEILNLNEPQKLYEKLNYNNQNLSKQIAYLYEISKFSENNCSKSILEKVKEKKENCQYKKESYSLEEPKQSFNGIESDNFVHELKDFEIKENIEKQKNKENKIIKYEKIKEKRFNEKERDKEREKEREKLIKKDKEEREKLKEKEKQLQNLKNIEKEKEKEIREKARKIIKQSKMKEREKENKALLKKNSNLNKKKIKYRYKNRSIKLDNATFPNKTARGIETDRGILTPKKKISEEEENLSQRGEIKRNKTPTREDNKFKYYLFDFKDENNSKLEEQEGKKFQRNNKRAKTVLYESIKAPFLIGFENYPSNNYISVSFTNRFMTKAKSPKKMIKKNNLIHIIVEEEDINNKYNKMNTNYSRTKTESSIKNKIKSNRNINDEYFSLDQFFIPYNNKKGEELFITKVGNVLINKRQKDILEDYINNNLFEDDDNKSKNSRNKLYNIVPISKGIKEKLKLINNGKNKIFKLKGTNTQYDLNDITELFQILPASFQNPIDEFYLRKKKASLFDRSIFKICHKVIDNYKELEHKEDIFSKKKIKSKSKSKVKSFKYFMNSNNRNAFGLKKLYSS